jgi:hypothetical protein
MSKDPSTESGSGELDYGANQPTGGTNENTGRIDPQGPNSTTENHSPDKKKHHPTAAGDDDLPSDDHQAA